MFLFILTLSSLTQSTGVIPTIYAASSEIEPTITIEEVIHAEPQNQSSLETRIISESSTLDEEQIPYNPIPLQVQTKDILYPRYFEAVSTLVGVNSSDCAKFFNRMFDLKFGKKLWGNGWEIQLKKQNQEHLKLIWQIPEERTYRTNNLWYPWGYASERGTDFETIYSLLAQEETPIGALGFVYRYSNYRDLVGSSSNVLPQTHIAFLSGRSIFHFVNDTDETLSLKDLINKKYGIMKEYEESFVRNRIPIDTILNPGDSFAYQDYLIEEHFMNPVRGSLLEVFLRKHRNNRTDEVLRPMSFSRISDELIASQKRQSEILKENNLKIGTKEEFNAVQWESEEEKQQILDTFGITKPEREMFLPIPQ